MIYVVCISGLVLSNCHDGYVETLRLRSDKPSEWKIGRSSPRCPSLSLLLCVDSTLELQQCPQKRGHRNATKTSGRRSTKGQPSAISAVHEEVPGRAIRIEVMMSGESLIAGRRRQSTGRIDSHSHTITISRSSGAWTQAGRGPDDGASLSLEFRGQGRVARGRASSHKTSTVHAPSPDYAHGRADQAGTSHPST